VKTDGSRDDPAGAKWQRNARQCGFEHRSETIVTEVADDQGSREEALEQAGKGEADRDPRGRCQQALAISLKSSIMEVIQSVSSRRMFAMSFSKRRVLFLASE
jgi:hypothetical protein